MHYCIGDIHGCYDEMQSLIQKIQKDDHDAKIVFLGDFADRGPKVWETLNWMADSIYPGNKYVSVMGNHDRLWVDWFLSWKEWYNEQPLQDRVLNKMDRSKEPMPDYDFYEIAKKHNALKPRKLNRFLASILSMPYHKSLRVEPAGGAPVIFDIVHAWYSYDLPENSYGQRMFNTWARECGGNHANDHIIIHGHTPTISELYTRDPMASPGMISYKKNSINLDGGCCYFPECPEYPCMLCAICLETLKEYYSHKIEDRLGAERGREYREKYRSKENPFRAEMLERLGQRPRRAD